MTVHWRFFPERCSGNLNILFYDWTFVDGLKQKSCKNSENLLELIIWLKNITYYTLMNKSVYIKLFNLSVMFVICFLFM